MKQQKSQNTFLRKEKILWQINEGVEATRNPVDTIAE
jgi:hypothetical protein